MSFATVFAVRTPANKNSPSAMITGSTLDSVACASTAAGGVSCTDVSAAHPLITPAISAIAINFFIVVYPLLTMRHPDKGTYFKSKRLQNQSAKIRKNPFTFETYITDTIYLPSTEFRGSGRSSSTKARLKKLEATRVIGLIDSYRRTLELTEIEERLQAVESNGD